MWTKNNNEHISRWHKSHVFSGHFGGDAVRPQRLRGRQVLLPQGPKQPWPPGAVAGARGCGAVAGPDVGILWDGEKRHFLWLFGDVLVGWDWCARVFWENFDQWQLSKKLSKVSSTYHRGKKWEKEDSKAWMFNSWFICFMFILYLIIITFHVFLGVVFLWSGVLTFTRTLLCFFLSVFCAVDYVIFP